MSRKRKFISAIVVLAAVGLFILQPWSTERTLTISDFATGEVYYRTSVKVGDQLFVGWVHSWEKIPWYEWYHIAADGSIILDKIAYPAFGAGIPENKGKKCYIKDGLIFMDEIGQVFPRFDWLNSHFATRDIKLNDELLLTGKDLPEHRRLILQISERRFWHGGEKDYQLGQPGCR